MKTDDPMWDLEQRVIKLEKDISVIVGELKNVHAYLDKVSNFINVRFEEINERIIPLENKEDPDDR